MSKVPDLGGSDAGGEERSVAKRRFVKISFYPRKK